jgi:hypothetical protein
VSAAIISVVAVVVGAVFTGVATDIIQRRRRRSAGRAAALAIAAELDLLASKLDSATAARGKEVASAAAVEEPDAAAVEEPDAAAVEEPDAAAVEEPDAVAVIAPGWWVGVPPTNAWNSSFEPLAAVAPRELIRTVAKAYGQAESWQAERELAGDHPPPPSEANIRDLKKDVQLAEGARDDLNLFATGGRWRKALRWTPDTPGWRRALTTWVPAFLATLAFVAFLAAPRDDINAQTVARAVERAYGPKSIAECDHVANHWSCSAFTLPLTRTACLSGEVHPPTGVSPSTVAAHGPLGGCVLSPPKHVTVVDLGDDLLLTPGDRERGRNRGEMTEPATQHSLIWKAWRVFWGQSPNG